VLNGRVNILVSKFAKEFEIDGRKVGNGNPAYIIAEAGISHFGDEDKAYQLVDLAVNSGADAVKFQVFDVDAMMAEELVDWRKRLGSRSLPYKTFERIQAYCREKDITFFATAHDEPSLDFLIDINIPVHKIGSGEVGNWAYIEKVARIGKPFIFSTGMYQFSQIQEALGVIAEANNFDVAVLHCVTSYPTPPEDVSLRNMRLIQEQFEVVSGYSDHTEGFHIPLAAVALGASIIEKHITLEYDIPNAQDWKVSCGPDDLGIFISQVRDIEATLTSRETGPTDLEQKNQEWATKSLIMRDDLSAGNVISERLLTSKRPGTGISPSELNNVLGRTLRVNVKRDQVLKWEDLD